MNVVNVRIDEKMNVQEIIRLLIDADERFNNEAIVGCLLCSIYETSVQLIIQSATDK